VPETPDKPAGTETHPPGSNPERQGPGGKPEGTGQEQREPKTPEPRPETGLGAPGISRPKQGKV